MVKSRYASWDSGIGAEIEVDKRDFKSFEKYTLDKGDVTLYFMLECFLFASISPV